MTLITLPYRTQLAAGQPEDIGMVLADFDAILAVVNGDIRNDNLASAAAIGIAKLAGYPADGTKFLAGDATWKTGASGAFAQITDTLFAVDTSSWDIQSIPSGAAIIGFMYERTTQAAVTSSALIRFNNDSGANYDDLRVTLQGGTAVANPNAGTAATSARLAETIGANANANEFAECDFFIPHYAGTVNRKIFSAKSARSEANAPASSDLFVTLHMGRWRSNSAITRITILPASGNHKADSRLTMERA